MKIYFIWAFVLVTVVALLVVNVDSDFRPILSSNQHHGYEKDFSLGTIFQGLGYYLCVCVHQIDDVKPLLPIVACSILVALAGVTLLAKNWLSFLGLIWWLSFSVILATLTNQYVSQCYPYPPMLGAAMYLAGILTWLGSKVRSVAWKRGYGVFVVLLGALVAFSSWCWLYQGSIANWYVLTNRERLSFAKQLEALTPPPPLGTRLVFLLSKESSLAEVDFFVKIVLRDYSYRASVVRSVDQFNAEVDKKDYSQLMKFSWDGTTLVPYKEEQLVVEAR
jgi:hypothetical protein